jgi:hypothetical protein
MFQNKFNYIAIFDEMMVSKIALNNNRKYIET